MKKYIVTVLLGCMSLLAANAQQEGIRFFEGTWEEALAKSAKENKLIFIDCNTSWCGPCKILARDVFTQKKIGDFYNANFINVSMDMEKGPGPDLAHKFSLTAYPTMFFLKPGGYVVNTVVGLKDADTLLICAKSALKHKDSVSLAERFNKGPRDTAFLHYFVTALVRSQPTALHSSLLDTVIAQEGYEVLLQEKYFALLPVVKPSNPIWEWFLNHYAQFVQRFGADAVHEQITDMYTSRTVLNVLSKQAKRDSTVFTQYRKQLQAKNLPCITDINMVIDFYLDCNKGDFDEAITNANVVLGSNAKAWQLHLLARWADWLTVGVYNSRFKAAQWAYKAAAARTNPVDIAECKSIADDLLNEMTPTRAYPSPRVYGFNVF